MTTHFTESEINTIKKIVYNDEYLNFDFNKNGNLKIKDERVVGRFPFFMVRKSESGKYYFCRWHSNLNMSSLIKSSYDFNEIVDDIDRYIATKRQRFL